MADFEEPYWEANYATPECMDGIFNATRHVAYIKAVFDMEYVHINSVIDFGFGLGHLFETVLETLLPARAVGVEPSKYAYRKTKARNIKPVDSMTLRLINQDIEAWCASVRPKARSFDLGLCTSVLQYLSDDAIAEVLPTIASRVRYLYLTVPTDRELDRQVSELKFRDEYAIRRSRERYLELIAPHFTIFSSRMLESRSFFDEDDTAFTDLLYRF